MAGCFCLLHQIPLKFPFIKRSTVVGSPAGSVNLVVLTLLINRFILPIFVLLIIFSDIVKSVNSHEYQQFQQSNSNWGIFGNPPISNINGYFGGKSLNDAYSIGIEQKNNKNQNHQVEKQQKYSSVQQNKEFQKYCKTTLDCRHAGYYCSTAGYCECNDGYIPNKEETECIGTIGKKCMYDNHCINGAYCKGQTICTCKLEYPYISRDKRSCEANGSKAVIIPLLPSSSLLSIFIVLFFSHITKAYIV